MEIVLFSTLTCPECGFSEKLEMPANFWQVFHTCAGCGTVLRPKSGDCCVYCSYGDVHCPSKQREAFEDR